MSRYTGNERATSRAQVVRYLTQNYADAEGNLMPEETAFKLIDANAAEVRKGIELFGSNVYYIGDIVVQDEPWYEVEGDDDDEEEDGDDGSW